MDIDALPDDLPTAAPDALPPDGVVAATPGDLFGRSTRRRSTRRRSTYTSFEAWSAVFAPLPAARPTRQSYSQRPHLYDKPSWRFSGQRAEKLRPPPTRCACPHLRRAGAALAALACSPPREGPCWRAPRASPRAAKDKPSTQVRCAADQPPVLRNGKKREARAASRRAPARAGHRQGRAVRVAEADFGGKNAHPRVSNHTRPI